MWALKT